ncbi:hypothetical protein PLCT2_01040 [Planctomycetaceae bacterium]|nr:hypothetical protein PLCT2_01040 [Planctomycetaceae bacterium]
MTNTLMNADAMPSPALSATTAIGLAAKHGASTHIIGVLETEDDPEHESPAGGNIVRVVRQKKQEWLHTLYADASRNLGTEREKSRYADEFVRVAFFHKKGLDGRVSRIELD